MFLVLDDIQNEEIFVKFIYFLNCKIYHLNVIRKFQIVIAASVNGIQSVESASYS